MKDTKKFITVLILLVTATLFFYPAHADQPKIENMELYTATATGSWLKIGAGIAEKTNDFFQGFPITALPSTGSVGNPPLVSDAKDGAQFGMSYGPFLVAARDGEEPYDKKFKNLRAIAALTPTVVHFQADVKPVVNSVEELLTKKIKINLGIPSKGGGSYYISRIIFSLMGFKSIDDIKKSGGSLYYGGSEDLMSAWKDRHTNANIIALNVPAAAIEESLVSRKGVLLNMGDKLLKELKERKGFFPFTIPAGTYSGQDKNVVTAALNLVVFARDNVPENVVYYMTKAIYENKKYFTAVHGSFKEFNPKTMASGLGIAMHKGAEKYYREIGLIK